MQLAARSHVASSISLGVTARSGVQRKTARPVGALEGRDVGNIKKVGSDSLRLNGLRRS